ncbi:MSMEG_4193 family putative phosphomutase [Nocardioides yefusunii]|uniref:MSMEG_4193 family putative phosphomutase n=1 Tax=Nocardioides yefusunii TaxID=2500546 RepID=A0ABW1QVJ3_9ACTN|nr:MSMEG_4193 family putative phosphomutase [Nocardioides yefusunii]
MATVVLVRHGRSTANTSGVLAGRTPGVLLDDHGEAQVAALGARLTDVRFAAAVTSPLERCVATATAALSQVPDDLRPSLVHDPAVLECDYGEWQGRTIAELAKEPLWSVVQAQPSRVTFPGGESMGEMSHRVVRAVREHDARIEAEHGPGAVWLLASHGDPLKAVLADALGMHLDLFQRVMVDPASVSVVRYSAARPYVVTMNSAAGDLGWLTPPPSPDDTPHVAPHGGTTASDDAVIGGGAGAPTGGSAA